MEINKINLSKQLKNRKINVKVSDYEYQHFKRIKKEYGLTPSELIRNAVIFYAIYYPSL